MPTSAAGLAFAVSADTRNQTIIQISSLHPFLLLELLSAQFAMFSASSNTFTIRLL